MKIKKIIGWGLGLPVGFILFLMLLGELLIIGNEWLLGEQADYTFGIKLQSQNQSRELDLPGEKSYTPPVLPYSRSEQYHSYLLELFAPVFLQKVSHHPEWDIPLFLDFDGNAEPRDNISNEPSFRPHKAGVHGEVTAETDDSFYLTYSLYHIKDYDHPVREILNRSTFHDNDNEGLKIRVDKKSMTVKEAECWFHNRFFLCNETGDTQGTEPIQGILHFENKTHLVVYAQSMGHGVRCAQRYDINSIDQNVKILRYQGPNASVPIQANRSVQIDGTYQIKNFDAWYKEALGPFGHDGQGPGLFEKTIKIGKDKEGQWVKVGRFIGGKDFKVDSWARPKPPWSWDDGWDNIPNTMWHFFPSYAFQSHMGSDLNHTYISNRPIEKIFKKNPEEVLSYYAPEKARRPGKRWWGVQSRGQKPTRKNYRKAVMLLLKRYVNRLFNRLG